jgi:hypothetical protein
MKERNGGLLNYGMDFPLKTLAYRLYNLAQVSSDSDMAWATFHSGHPYQLFTLSYSYNSGIPFEARLKPDSVLLPPVQYNPAIEPRFSLNLVEAVKRQWVFSKKITSIFPQDYVSQGHMLAAQKRYAKFMYLAKTQGSMFVPTPEIDLYWHTHQLSQSNYGPWCQHHIGRYINHDDTIEEGGLSTGFETTKQAWSATFQEDYIFYTPVYVPNRIPPPSLTPAQRALWDFDVAKQMEFEQLALEIRPYRLQARQYAEARQERHANRRAEMEQRRADRRNGVARPSSSNPQSSVLTAGSLFRGVLEMAATASARPQPPVRPLHAERDRFNPSKLLLLRWPLVYACRSEKGPCPVYQATWYSKKGPDFYDYGYGGVPIPDAKPVNALTCGIWQNSDQGTPSNLIGNSIN